MFKNHHGFEVNNAWYPKHVSDRADELIGELNDGQLRLLFNALAEQSLPEWFTWIEEARTQIVEYDRLTPRERKRRMQKTSSFTLNLLYHHACIFIELWRARTHSRYFHFPPHGPPVNSPEAQRDMMLAVLASHRAFNARDLWPFEFPDGEARLPFRESES